MRRGVTRTTVIICVVLGGAALHAHAQRGGPYPSAPVRIIVGFPPGGGVDVVARMVGQKMSGLWGQPVIVENRPGAASMIGTRLAAAATADGYSILINSNTLVVNQILNANAGYDIERQFTPVINLAWQPNIIAAAKALPASNLRELIALAKTTKFGYGTPGQGSMPHLAAVFLFNKLAQVDLLHVPYSGAAPALTATIAGQPELSVVTLPPAVPLVKAGRLKALAVTSAKRTGALSEVPTVAESGFPGYEVNVFSGFFVPRGTPAAATDRLRATVLQVLAMPDIQSQLATLGFEPADNAAEDFSKRVAGEIRQWRTVLAGFKLD